MKPLISGIIKDNVPFFSARVNKNKILEFGSGGKIKITADTGFTEGIALPKKILNQLQIEFIAYESFILADGSTVNVEVYFGVVKIGSEEIETTFIEGDHLMGMAFMSAIASEFRAEFSSGKIELLNEPRKP